MTDSSPIAFYDIASAPPATTFAPNPWKTRYALNFKGVNYETKWVELPDVKATRMGLGSAPVRTFADGEDFYTLPVIQDTATGKVVGDTFDIACYLDETYPDEARTLIPAGYAAAVKEFNTKVDKIFTDHVLLTVQGLPFNPATAHISKAEFARRARKSSWEEMIVTDPARRAELLQSLKKALDQFVIDYAGHRRRQNFSTDRTDGQILDGKHVPYADIIVGAWLQFFKITCPEFEQVKTWHDGLWCEFLNSLDQYALVK